MAAGGCDGGCCKLLAIEAVLEMLSKRETSKVEAKAVCAIYRLMVVLVELLSGYGM